VYPKVFGQRHNEINNNKNKHSFRSNTVMVAKLTRLTHEIAVQLQKVVPFAVLAPGGQSGNFWIHPRTNRVRTRDIVDLTKSRVILTKH
jgi:hypothetical protein